MNPLSQRLLNAAKVAMKDPVVKQSAQALINSIIVDRFGHHESGKNMLERADIDEIFRPKYND